MPVSGRGRRLNSTQPEAGGDCGAGLRRWDRRRLVPDCPNFARLIGILERQTNKETQTMRPLFRSLFVLSVFGVLAAHVSVGALRALLDGTTVLALIDRILQVLLITPFGRDIAVFALLALGAVLALWAYIAAQMSDRHGRGQSYSTW